MLLDRIVRPIPIGRGAIPAHWERSASLRRIATWTAVGVLFVLAAHTVMLELEWIAPARFGDDRRFYATLGQRWLDSGVFYLPNQLAGPYQMRPNIDNLYPPNALLLFAPLTVLPAPLWWLVPAAVLGWALRRWRPAVWAWAGIALIVAWPWTVGAVLLGNTDMWMAALVAAGLIWGWPAFLLVLKPTMAPFALLGARHRSWWAAAGLVVVLAVLMLPLWLDHLAAMRDIRGIGPDYSLGSLPFVLVPFLAWAGRRRSSKDSTIRPA